MTDATDLVPCTRPGCSDRVKYVLTLGNRRWPINPEPDPDGTIVLIEQDDGSIRAKVLSGSQLPAQQTAYVDHDRTCRTSPDHARRAAAQQRKCFYCGTAMADALVELGEDGHPNCLPPLDLRDAVQRAREQAQDLRAKEVSA